MSWHYLQELAADCLEASSTDGEPSAPSRLKTTAGACCCSDSETGCSTSFQCGMTCDRSTGDRGVDAWISSLGDSRANRSAKPASARRKTTTATCGPILSGSFARFDRDSHSWRTSQLSLFTSTSEQFLATYPKRGSMRGGKLYRQKASALRTDDRDYSLWPTPTASDCLRTKLKSAAFLKQKERNAASGHGAGVSSGSLTGAVVIACDYCPAPEFHEWMMGIPRGWTDLKPLEICRFRQWLEQHGTY